MRPATFLRKDAIAGDSLWIWQNFSWQCLNRTTLSECICISNKAPVGFELVHLIWCCVHCMKSVQIRNFFWSIFSCIRIDTEIYSVNLCISPNTGKYEPEKIPYLDTFHVVVLIDLVIAEWISIRKLLMLKLLLILFRYFCLYTSTFQRYDCRHNSKHVSPTSTR